jgi:hypothetical protein
MPTRTRANAMSPPSSRARKAALAIGLSGIAGVACAAGPEPRLSFVVGDQFFCGGDRFSPIDFKAEKFCPEFLEDQPTSMFLIAEGDFCQDYDGEHRFASPQSVLTFSRGAGTSGGIIGFDVNANTSGAVSMARGPSGEMQTVQIMADAVVENPFVDPKFLDPDCFGIGSSVTAQIDATVRLTEPGRVFEVEGAFGTLMQFQVGDIVPAGEYTMRVSLFAGYDPLFDPPGTYVLEQVAEMTLEFPDCDGNGINDLLELDSDGNGVGDACEPMQNLTQGTGYANIQDAINAANAFDVIQVAPGFYRQQVNPAGKALVIQSIDPGDPGIVGSTVFSGDLDDNGVGELEPLLVVSGEDNGTVISGLTFTRGFPGGGGIAGSAPILDRCSFFDNSADFGAGVTVFDAAPIFLNCRFESNIATVNGGGADVFGGSLAEFIDCEFQNNLAGVGGGLHVFDATAVVTDSLFFQNGATLGAGLAVVAQSSVAIDRSTFDNNTGEIGAGLFANTQSLVAVGDSFFLNNFASNSGGGFYADATEAVAISSSEFSGNSADRGGAATFSNALDTTLVENDIEFNFARLGAGIEILAGSDVDIIETQFTSNQASESAGGLVVFDSLVDIERSTFFSNTALAAGGGAALAADARVVIRDSLFESNAADFGGGLYVENSASVFRVNTTEFFRNNARIGGGIAVRPSATMLVSDSLLTQNVAEFGGALDVFNGSLTVRSSTISLNTFVNGGDGSGISSGGQIAALTVRNSIVWDDSFFLGSATQPTIEYSVIPGGFPGTGNVSGDPLFENAPDRNFALRANSSAIDAGSNNFPTGTSTDFYGQPRFQDDSGVADTGDGVAPIIDIGAAEFQGTSPSLCLADFNADGFVNILDVVAFIAVWNNQAPGADYNADGFINILDVVAFIAVWNAGCP